MAIIGIDLGTTNSLASVWRNGRCELIPNSFGEFLTPSVVGFDDEGNVIIGKIAKQRLVSHPDLTAASFKCFMGTKQEISLGKKVFTPPELSSFILRQLKEDAELYLGEPVEEAVISVPAYFDDNGRSATKLAGELAGLKVERIINEPSAAALAYKQGTDNEDMFLIFDFGGGTLDISIVDIFDSVIEIIAVAGDNHLGGDDFNRAIAEHFCKENHLNYSALPSEVKAIVLKQAELCKIALSTQPEAAMVLNYNDHVYTLALDNQKLLTVTADLFERIEKPIVKALHDASVSANEISEVILIGGSSHMLLVQKYLENLFDTQINVTISPDTAVALGVGIASGIKARNEDIKDMVLTDICPFSLGTGIRNRENEYEPYFCPIIERNTTLPASIVKRFYSSVDNQRVLSVDIAQGEKMYLKQNLFLDEIEIDIKPAPAGEKSIDVRFSYDINGILQVDVTNNETGKVISKTIVNNNRLSEKEIKSKLAQLEKLKIHPRDLDKNKLLIARAESLYEESIGDLREIIRFQLERFNNALSIQDSRKIRKTTESFSRFLDSIENGGYNPFSNFNDYDSYEDEEDYD